MKLPLLGKISVLSLSVLLASATFAVFWSVTRRESYSWIGQDMLVSPPVTVCVPISCFYALALDCMMKLFNLCKLYIFCQFGLPFTVAHYKTIGQRLWINWTKIKCHAKGLTVGNVRRTGLVIMQIEEIGGPG